ncbi:MAG: aminoacyltransferase [Mollicutes bacterium]|nr:aminoacyltransferase [Mollicutes bacterium]
MEFIELNEKEYKKFYNDYQGTFLQSPEMARVNEQTNNQTFFLGVKKNNNIVAASLFIVRKNKNRYYLYSPRGLQVDYNDLEILEYYVKSLKKFAQEKKYYMIKIDPYIELYSRNSEGEKVDGIDNSHFINTLNKFGFKYLNFSVQKKWFYVLDINNRSEEEMFNNFRSTVRNIIRKCQRIGIEIEEIEEDFTRFSNIVSETAERKNFSVRDDEYYSLMKKEFEENLKVMIAKINLKKYLKNLNEELNELELNFSKIKGEGKRKNHQDNINNIKSTINKVEEKRNEHGEVVDLAASMFLISDQEIIYLYSGSKEEFLFLNAPYLLQWEIIKETIKRKIPRYNFYGIEDLSDPSIKNRGVYEFKKGFNGNVIETIGELDLYLCPKEKFKYYLKKIIKKK